VGFLAAEGPVYTALVNCKRVNDLTTSNLYQRAVEAYVTVGRYQTHLHRSCLIYRKRRDAMLQAVDRLMPDGVSAFPPQGGLFIWLKLPGHLSTAKLLSLACEEGVAFSPGSAHYPGGTGGENCMRLNFVTSSVEDIEEGIRRLARAIKRLEKGQPVE
jgi:GntR family transcriptional regulator/MocR family aminotransferase